MARTLEVTEELCWMPAGWVFDTVLERMAAEIDPQEPALAARLLAARTKAEWRLSRPPGQRSGNVGAARPRRRACLRSHPRGKGTGRHGPSLL